MPNTSAETHPPVQRLVPLRPLRSMLLVIVAGLILYPLAIEIPRHLAFVEFQTNRSGSHLSYQAQIPSWLARRLPRGWSESWFVHVNDITVNATDTAARVDFLALARRFPEALALHLSATDVDDALLERISQFTGIEELSFDVQNIRGGWERLSNLTRLKRLYLHAQNISPGGLAKLKQLPALRTVHIHTDELDGPHLDDVAHIRQLESLALNVGNRFDGNLSQLQETELHFLYVQLPRAESLRGLYALTHLKALTLNVKDLSDSDLEELLPLKSLERLNLETDGQFGGGLFRLREMLNLENLSITAPVISQAGVEALTRMRPLLELAIRSRSLRRTYDSTGNPQPFSAWIQALRRRPHARVIWN